MYIEHKILENGWIKLAEKIDGNLHRSMIAPNQSVQKYNDIIEADEDFASYRTQVNIDAYIENSTRPQPSIDDWRASAVLTRRKFMLAYKRYPWGEGALKQAIDALLQKLLKSSKQAEVQMGEVMQESLDETTEFTRTHPDVIAMATAIGMSAEDLDGFYTFAENEEWRK